MARVAACLPAAQTRGSLYATLAEMAGELVQHRGLLWQMTLRDVRIRYKQALMGFGWAILMPVLIVGAGLLIKFAMTQMAGTGLGPGNFAGLAVKALGWAFFVGAVGFATPSLTSNLNLVTKIYFPREVLPLSAVLTQAFDSLIGSTAVAAVVFVFLGVGLAAQTLWVVPLVLLLVLLTAGACLFLSCANLFFRDVRYIVQVLLTFGIFFTPVFYDVENLGPTGAAWMMLNPVAVLLEGLRLAVVDHHNLLEALALTTATGRDVVVWHPWYLLYELAWCLGGCLFAWLLFHKLESVYAEYI
jgi:ABC-type polysaccharide/polyol phosphate export permease